MKPHYKKKDQRIRENYFLNEKKYFLLKLVQSNQLTPFEIRLKTNKKLNKLTHNSKSKIRNRCLITNRGRSIYRPFNLTRHQFKLHATNGDLIGVKKSSW